MPDPTLSNLTETESNPYRDSQGRLIVHHSKHQTDPNLKLYEDEMKALADDMDLADAVYDAIQDSCGGKVISTDIARELLYEYREVPEGAMVMVNATGCVAQAYAKDRLWREIRERRKDKDKPLLVTAGGIAAGKSSFVTPDVIDLYSLVFDGTLRETEWAKKVIQEAVDLGWTVEVIYVQRPLHLAAYGAIERASRKGRWAPYAPLPKTHQEAQRSIVLLAKHFQPIDNVGFKFILNHGTTRDVPVRELDLNDIDSGGAYSYFSISNELHQRTDGSESTSPSNSSGSTEIGGVRADAREAESSVAEQDADRRDFGFGFSIPIYPHAQHAGIFAESVHRQCFHALALCFLAKGNKYLEEIAGKVEVIEIMTPSFLKQLVWGKSTWRASNEALKNRRSTRRQALLEDS